MRAFVQPAVGRIVRQQFLLDQFKLGIFFFQFIKARYGVVRMFVFLTLHALAHLTGHCPANVVRRVLAHVRDDNRDFARLNLFRRLRNHLKDQRIDVVGAGQ